MVPAKKRLIRGSGATWFSTKSLTTAWIAGNPPSRWYSEACGGGATGTAAAGGGGGAIMLAQAERLIAAATAAKLVIQERFIGLPRFLRADAVGDCSARYRAVE